MEVIAMLMWQRYRASHPVDVSANSQPIHLSKQGGGRHG